MDNSVGKGHGDRFELKVTASSGSAKIRDISCHVALPVKNSDRLKLELFPNTNQYKKLEDFLEFKISGAIRGFQGSIGGKFEAHKVYLLKARREGTSLDVKKRWHCETSPADVTVTQILRSKAAGGGRFWLTPNRLLAPVLLRYLSDKGEVKVHYSRVFTTVLRSGLNLSFMTSFTQVGKDKETETTLLQLVANFNYPKHRENAVSRMHTRLVPDLDDFLLICSFACRQKTVCSGWTLEDYGKLIRHYREAVSIPPPSEIDRNETLVDPENFESFVLRAYEHFSSLEEAAKVGIRQALAYAIPRQRTFENTFISLYSSIEHLLSASVRQPNVGNIFPAKEWHSLQKDLKAYLKSHPSLVTDERKRKLVYEKLPELNRASFAAQFDMFVQAHSIDLGDLWPAVGSDGLASLSWIRNRLIHGGTFNEGQRDALIVAKEHLTWTVERLLLSFLGWGISLSKVSRDFLSRYAFDHSGWEASRSALSVVSRAAMDHKDVPS